MSASKLVYPRSREDFNKLVEGLLSRRSGHGYQDTARPRVLAEDPKKGALASPTTSNRSELLNRRGAVGGVLPPPRRRAPRGRSRGVNLWKVL